MARAKVEVTRTCVRDAWGKLEEAERVRQGLQEKQAVRRGLAVVPQFAHAFEWAGGKNSCSLAASSTDWVRISEDGVGNLY